MAYDVPQLLTMTYAELDALFSNSPAGDIPDGPAKGTAIIASDTKYCQEIADLINIFGWQGKTFDKAKGILRNRITILGISAIIAKVYKSASWLDDKECVVLDYSDTSVIAHWIRDEIRLIAPDFYLGRVYWAKKPLIHFCLQFGAAAAAATQGS
jgi:hypothetical protein